MIGCSIAHYRISGKLGEGGMGAVYRAHDTKLGRDVAIKVLPPALANDADYIARFQREAQVLASLNHPNIAAIYGLEDNAIVMELVEGAELKGPLRVDEAVRIAKQIADALEAAHERGIIHRDLKPANIRITADGTVKVLDFGLAKTGDPARAASASAANSPTLTIHATNAGMILGTAAYMSPEQAKGAPVDRRADIWAFGIVLWEMVTGRQLFAGDTVSETLAAVLRDEVDLNAVPAGPVRTLVGRCLERDVRRRLGWIGEARAILDTPPATVATKRIWLPWAVAASALALAAALALRQPAALPAEVTTFTITAPEKEHFHTAAASPDGKRVALEVDEGGGSETTYIGIRSMDSLDLVRLPGTETGYNPFWSPDSKSVAFFNKSGKLRRIELNGTAAVSICDVPFPNYRYRGSWHSSGAIILSSMGNRFNTRIEGTRIKIRGQAGPSTGPWIVPAAGGTPKQLPVQAGEPVRANAQLLPDGKRYLFNTPAGGEIRLASVGKSESELVLEAGVLAGFLPSGSGSARGHLLFRRGDRLYAQRFDASAVQLAGEPAQIGENVHNRGSFYDGGGASDVIAYQMGDNDSARLQWMTLEGAANVFDEPRAYDAIALAPDGKRVAATARASGGSEIWIIDVERRIHSRLSTGAGSKRSALWSPDGSRIVYVVTDGAAHKLYSQGANGGGLATLLLESSDPVTPNSFSPDGRTLVYSALNQRTRWDLWMLGPDGKPQPYLRTEVGENQGHISPDGRFLAYTSNEAGQLQIYVRTFPDATGGKWQVSNYPGAQPRWSPDGARLYWLDGGRRLTVSAVSTRARFESGNPAILFPVMVPAAYSGGMYADSYYAPASDGKRIVAMVGPEGGTPIVVLQNWRAKLQ